MTFTDINIRLATLDDLPAIVQLLTQDEVAGSRENYSDPIAFSYIQAFKQIESEPNNEIIVAELDKKIIASLQFTIISCLTNQGGKRAHIEAVMVAPNFRAQGIGSTLLKWAINRAQQKDCYVVQLTSNKKRQRAHCFYQRLGFKATHEGFKLEI